MTVAYWRLMGRASLLPTSTTGVISTAQRFSSKVLLICAGLLLNGCSSLPQHNLQQNIQAAGLMADQVSLVLLPLQSGKPVLYRAEALMQPASTMKLVTTTVALAELGPLWQGETRLLARTMLPYIDPQAGHSAELSTKLAPPVDTNNMPLAATLAGPLIIQGKADPEFSYAELAALLRQLYDRGLRQIPAGLQIDRSYFYPERPAIDAPPFDEAPRARYNHQPDALMLNQNMQQLHLSADSQQIRGWFSPNWQPLKLDLTALQLSQQSCADYNVHTELHIQLQPLHVVNQAAATKNAPLKPVSRSANKNQDNKGQHNNQRTAAHPPTAPLAVALKLSGKFPANCQQNNVLELLDRDINLWLAVQTIWRQLGGDIGRSLIFQPAAPADQLLAVHQGRPLPEIVRRINKSSDNALARLLHQVLGATAVPAAIPAESLSANTSATTTLSPYQQIAHTGDSKLSDKPPANTAALADQRIKQWFSTQQLNPTGMIIDNGSGLSRSARISAAQMAGLLKIVWQQNYAPELIGSLPLAGIDGTLQRRLTQAATRGKARLKTGSLRNVTALAGYIWDQQQQPWVFVAMVNAEQASAKGRPLLDKWVELAIQQQLTEQ